MSEPTTRAKRTSRPRLQFDLKTLLLAPVFLAVLGAIGVWVDWDLAFALMPILLGVLLARSRATTWVEALVIAAFVGILIAVLLPATQSSNPAPRRRQCSDNLKHIMLALHNYHDTYGSFPPAYVADEDGQPIHSWRVLILPFLDQQELYDQYDFSQPWNSPDNSMLSTAIPYRFLCPSDTTRKTSDTSYLLITGEESAWPGDHAPSLDEITDDPGQTIVLVEVVNSGISWTEPRDLLVSNALRGINGAAGLCISSLHPEGAIVGLADGSIFFVHERTSRQQLRAMVTPDGGEVIHGGAGVLPRPSR